jgi:NAD(P)-dependent dehydrogenase (short-subunit alcohol dehydrogenase family)
MADTAAPAEPGDDVVVQGFDLSDDAVLRRLVESVRTIASDPETYETQSRFRPLRRALEPLMERYATRQGEILERARKRQLRKEAQSRASKQAHQDKLHRDNTRLRFGRIENLAALTEDGGGGGAVATLDAVAGLLADGVDGAAGGRGVAYLTQVPDGAVKDEAGRSAPTRGLLGTTTTEDGGATSVSAKKNERGRNDGGGGGASAAATSAENDTDAATSSSASGDFFANDHGRATNTLHTSRQCYTCKARFSKLHHFYAQFCESCAAVNWKMRGLSADLTGKVALLTGARVKIGFEIGLKLLRAGATLLATTRFPADAHRRYAAEDDFEVWKQRLHVHAVDLRDVRGLEAFCAMLNETLPRLDIIVNNACQTVRRPVSYYAHLLPEERKLDALVSAAAGRGEEEGGGGVDGGGGDGDASPAVPPALAAHAERVLRDRARVARSENASSASIDASEADETGETSVVPSGTSGDETKNLLRVGAEDADAFFPTPAQLSQLKLVAEDDVSLPALGALDVNGQQIDLRTNNSWRLKLDEVPLPELAEVMAINAMAPFVLNARLTTLLEKSAAMDGNSKRAAFIVNVSAMEGKFYRHKTPNHPHTNMAKAALNMMTRTSAAELAEKKRVFMTAVDTGWINDENPRHIAARIAKTHDFQTPIDEVDAAARVLHPVFHGYAPGVEPLRGVFLKDYVATEW